jgi:cytochrome c biogenesis protein CcdA
LKKLNKGDLKMISGILQLLPLIGLAIMSAYISYKMDMKYSYVEKINKKYNFDENKSMLFFLGLMVVMMVLVPGLLVLGLGMSRNVPYVLVSLIVGFCCYSALDYKESLKRVEAAKAEEVHLLKQHRRMELLLTCP